MFNKEKTSANGEKSMGSATLISAGTVLTGDLKSESDLRIDGTIYGNVSSSAKIVVGPTGFIEGNLDGRQADVTGKVVGNIKVNDLLQLRGDCNVQGNLNAGTLQIDPSAVFNGQCQMAAGNNVVLMSTADEAAVEVN